MATPRSFHLARLQTDPRITPILPASITPIGISHHGNRPEPARGRRGLRAELETRSKSNLRSTIHPHCNPLDKDDRPVRPWQLLVGPQRSLTQISTAEPGRPDPRSKTTARPRATEPLYRPSLPTSIMDRTTTIRPWPMAPHRRSRDCALDGCAPTEEPAVRHIFLQRPWPNSVRPVRDSSHEFEGQISS